MKNALREILASWQAAPLPELVERVYSVKPSKNIVAVVGPRRAGKTFFLYQVAKTLMGREGYEKENVAFVDFEDVRLKALKPEDYSSFVCVLHEMTKEKDGKIVLLLDEVQNLGQWESWLRTLHNSQKYLIWASGSSSKLSSAEVATQLRGRYSSLFLLPFSFKEFLKYKNITEFQAPESSGVVLQALREYLAYGGFPAVVETEDANAKTDLLKTYKETIFYRDVVERFHVRDVSSLQRFLDLTAENFGKYLSLSKTEDYFKSIGIKKSKKTLANYLDHFRNAFFLFTVQKFGYKTKERVQQPEKVYPIDPGFFTLVPRFSQDLGTRAEAAVAQALYGQKTAKGAELFYWKDYQQHEVDFAVKQGAKISELIQVTVASHKGDAKDAVKTLLKAGRELACRNLTAITWDYEAKDKNVSYVPLWKWLLKQ